MQINRSMRGFPKKYGQKKYFRAYFVNQRLVKKGTWLRHPERGATDSKQRFYWTGWQLFASREGAMEMAGQLGEPSWKVQRAYGRDPLEHGSWEYRRVIITKWIYIPWEDERPPAWE